MNHFTIPLAATALASTLFAQITPGNLVVVRLGAGAAALSSASTATFLEEFTAAGAPVQTITMPTVASGLNLPFSNNGTATSEGFLTQSTDARYLVAAGYGTAPGLASVSSTTSATVNRVVARIGLDGSIDTTTALTDGFSGSNVRSAASTNGTDIWVAGTASAAANGGVRWTTLGATLSTQLSSTPTNIRVVNIFGNQIYCSSATGTFQGVSTVGTGLSTTTGQTTTLLAGFPTATGPQNYDFFFADADTVYVADDRTTGVGGIQKWTQSLGTWTLAYTLSAGTSLGCRGLSGYVENGVTTLFATTTQTSANTLITITDTGVASTPSVLATAAANTVFRGVRWVRRPANVQNSGTGCPTSFGLPLIGTNSAPVIGNLGFQITSSNNPPLSLAMHVINAGPSTAPVGFPIPGAPACAQLYVSPLLLLAELIDPAGNAFSAVPIPPNASLGGFQLSAQAFPFDLTLVGFSLPVGASDALDVTIGN